MSAFAIVVDSAADIPAPLRERYGIRMVPLHVTFPEREYEDGVDLEINEFLDKLAASDALPVTSQPAPADLIAAYQGLVDEGYTQILSLHLSAALSGTYETALGAARYVSEQTGARIEVVDSCAATVAQGTMALEAAVIARRGGSIEEALERVENIKRTYTVYFVPNSLDNLVRGGRASRFQGMATALLNIKIVVTLTETGAIDVLHKAKGMKSAMSYIVRRMAERSQEIGPVVYYRLHTKAHEALEFMERPLQSSGLLGRCITEGTIGPTIATHVGLGAAGLFFYPEEYHAPELDGIAEFFTPTF